MPNRSGLYATLPLVPVSPLTYVEILVNLATSHLMCTLRVTSLDTMLEATTLTQPHNTSLPWIAVMTRINAAKWMTTLGQSCLIATCVRTQEKFIQRLVELIVEREISAELQIGTTTPTCKGNKQKSKTRPTCNV